MDFLDKNILLDLLNYCRTTFQEMAEKNNVSANAIKKRFHKLVSNGTIMSFFVELSFAMIDAELSMNLVTTDGTEGNEFVEKIGNNPLVSYVGKLSGGIYNVFALYIGGASGLSELGSFLRSFPQVKDVEMHPLLYLRGEKTDFSTTQLKVLKYLTEDPRMAVSEITKRSGLTSRMISKTIKELRNEGKVIFSIEWNPNVNGNVFMLRIHWDESKSNFNEIMSFLQSKFPQEFLAPMISAVNPIIFATFVVDDLKRIQEITEESRKNPNITRLISYLGEPTKAFPDLKTIRLKEILNKAGM